MREKKEKINWILSFWMKLTSFFRIDFLCQKKITEGEVDRVEIQQRVLRIQRGEANPAEQKQ